MLKASPELSNGRGYRAAACCPPRRPIDGHGAGTDCVCASQWRQGQAEGGRGSSRRAGVDGIAARSLADFPRCGATSPRLGAHCPDAERVSEADLIRDVLDILQGIDGHYVKFEEPDRTKPPALQPLDDAEPGVRFVAEEVRC